MNMKLTILALGVVLLLAGVTPLMAADKMTTDKTTGNLSDQDREFIEKAAMGGLMEVQLGNVVAQRATNNDVKQFGQKMVSEHSKANSQLKQIAAQKGIQLPQQLDDKHKEKINELNKNTGPEFDREYMSHMVDDHEEDIDTFKEQAEDGQDPALKQFASQTVPKLEQHLAMAKQIEEKLKSRE